MVSSSSSSALSDTVRGAFLTLGAASRELLISNSTAIAKCFLDLENGAGDYRLIMRDHIDAITVPTPLRDSREGVAGSGITPTDDGAQQSGSETPTDIYTAFEDMTQICVQLADDNMLGADIPAWVNPTAKWICRALVDKIAQAYHIAIPVDCPLPARGDLKRQIAAARPKVTSPRPRRTPVPDPEPYQENGTTVIDESAVTTGVGITATHVDTTAAGVGTTTAGDQDRPVQPCSDTAQSFWTKPDRHSLHSLLRPLAIKENATTVNHETVLKQVNTLLGKPVLKEYQLDGSNPGTYPEWRVRICDEIDNYNCSREVTAEIVWACLNSTLRLRIRRRVPRSDILHRGHVAILDVLDDIYLTPNELKAFQSRWEGIAQEPNETIPEYALRFEELAHTRRILLRADVTESELVQKFSNGFKEPIAVLAKMLVDPLASLSYEAFKQAVISFVQSGDENILRVFGALTTTTTPTPLAPMQPPNPKRLLARNAVYDTDICYVHAHAAITESLGLDRRACLRCGKNTNHFARECDSPTIFRVSDRCHTCGDLRGPSHRCRISPRRVVCSRCLQAGHVAGVCKNQRKANSGRYAEVQSAEEESHFEDKFPVTTSKCAVITAMVAAAVRKDASDPIIDFLRRLPRQPEVHLTLGDKGAYCKTSCLVDSGANCSLISSGLTTYLTKRGVICEDDVLPLPNKIPIGVASGKTIIGSHLARARFASGQLDGVLEFLVCDNVDPDILLGTNMFPAIGVQLTSTGQADTTNFRCASSTTAAPPSPVLAACALPLLPTAEVVQTAEGKRVMCHCGPLGKLTIFPYREKQRQLSKANQQILSHRLSTMADQGKIQPCAEGECTVVLAPVICDKESGAKARVYPDPSVDKRYRITVDCRPINRLVLIEAGDSNMMLLPQAMVANGTNPLTDAVRRDLQAGGTKHHQQVGQHPLLLPNLL